jgi:hypothetical protein
MKHGIEKLLQKAKRSLRAAQRLSMPSVDQTKEILTSAKEFVQAIEDYLVREAQDNDNG